VALAVADGEVALRATDDTDVRAALDAAIERVDGMPTGTGRRARARIDTEDWTASGDEIVAAVREAL